MIFASTVKSPSGMRWPRNATGPVSPRSTAPRPSGNTRLPFSVRGARSPVAGVVGCRKPQRLVLSAPSNESDLSRHVEAQSNGPLASDPAWTRNQSYVAVPPPFVPRKAARPTFSGAVIGAAWPAWPISVQVAPSSGENSPITFVPS